MLFRLIQQARVAAFPPRTGGIDDNRAVPVLYSLVVPAIVHSFLNSSLGRVLGVVLTIFRGVLGVSEHGGYDC